jgi:predicted GNAT superfamily acetyltransferase
MASRYEVDFYGVSSSRLQGGLPTDRLVAQWQLDSPRVEAALQGRTQAPQVITGHIPVPAAIYQWKASEAGREQALKVQLENRRRFQEAFAQGLAVIGFTRDAEGNGVFELGPLTQAETGFNSQGR